MGCVMRQSVTSQTTIEIEYLRLPVSVHWRVRNWRFMAHVWRHRPEQLVGWVWKT